MQFEHFFAGHPSKIKKKGFRKIRKAFKKKREKMSTIKAH